MTVLPAGEVVVRQADRADLLSVFRIEKSVFAQPWPYSAFEQFVGEPGFLVATASDDVVGYVVADVTPNYGRDIGHIKDLAVHPDTQRQGLGRRLLERALFELAFAGAALVKLEVRETNDAARRLYEDFGFRQLRTVPRYYQDGEDALILVLDVADWQAGQGTDDIDE